jgi:hypothetical protein
MIARPPSAATVLGLNSNAVEPDRLPQRNHSLDEFLDAFPTVSKEQAVAALEAAHEAVTARARSAR